MSDPIWTIADVLKWTTGYFRENEIASPRLDAELLLASVCQCDRLRLYLEADRPLSDAERAAYRVLVRKRIARCPIAYLIGEKEFWGLKLLTQPGVLIPRPDTEILVEQTLLAMQQYRQSKAKQLLRVLELGTGTGAIPLALCLEEQQLFCLSFDHNTIALQIAQKNSQRYQSLFKEQNHQFYLVQSDGFSSFSSTFQFDFLISNPPYIRSADLPTLPPEVREYEPISALDGGKDGLYWYRYFLQYAPRFLAKNGEMLVEVGSDQGEELKRLVKQFVEWEFIKIYLDLQSHPRVFHARYIGGSRTS